MAVLNTYRKYAKMKTLWVLLVLLPLLATTAAAQKIALPCEIPTIEVAADGSGVWIVCSRKWKEIKQAQAEGKLPPAANDSPTDLYWLDMATKVPEKIASANADIRVIASRAGSRGLVVMPQQSGSGHAVLYERKQRVKELPVDASFLLWSGDSQRVYFYGGSTLQADGWNILGIYDLNSGTSKRVNLQEPTEILSVCQATGGVYSATPSYPGFAGSTIEYTDRIQFVRRIHGWIGARFSARCAYVASESDFHGPLPWAIYDTTNARKLFQFTAADDEAKDDVYSLVGWNPTHESMLLREHVSKGHDAIVEIFDVQSGRVLQTLPRSDVVAWSADGDNILETDGASLSWRSAKLSSPPTQ